MRYFLFSCFCFFPLKPRRLPQLFYLSHGKVHVWRSSPVGEFLPLPRLTLRTRRSFTALPFKKKNRTCRFPTLFLFYSLFYSSFLWFVSLFTAAAALFFFLSFACLLCLFQ